MREKEKETESKTDKEREKGSGNALDDSKKKFPFDIRVNESIAP